MATQLVEFHAPQDRVLTAQLFAVGSDTVVATASAVAAQPNRKVVYRATFADVAAGIYELIAAEGNEVAAACYVVLRAAAGTYRAGDYADLAAAVLLNRTVTDPTTGVMTVYAEDDTTALFTAALYEDAAGTQPYRGRGAERRNRLA